MAQLMLANRELHGLLPGNGCPRGQHPSRQNGERDETFHEAYPLAGYGRSSGAMVPKARPATMRTVAIHKLALITRFGSGRAQEPSAQTRLGFT